MCCPFSKHAAVRSNSNDCFLRSQDIACEFREIFYCGLIFQCTHTIKYDPTCWSSTQQDIEQAKLDKIILHINHEIKRYFYLSFLLKFKIKANYKFTKF